MPIPVSFSIDNLGDAADLHRGVITAPRPPGSNPALEQGYPALLDLCGRHQLPLTCFVEGWSAARYPDFIRQLQALGHEVGMHGWQHERWGSLPEAEIAPLAERATAAIAAALGQQPRAFRAPGGESNAHTRRVLAGLGYDLDASHAEISKSGASETPGVSVVPYRWSGVDATHWLWNRLADTEVEALWQRELNTAARAGQPFVFIWHPHVMGIDSGRLAVGERIIRFISDDPRFSVQPLRALARNSSGKIA